MTEIFNNFFNPTPKKLGWFFITYLVAQIYFIIIIDIVPYGSLATFIGFVLNPATIIVESMSGIEKQMLLPFANTLNLIWIYIISIVMTKELGVKK
jgi:hypothetical protein